MSFFKPLFEHKDIESKDIHQCPTLLDVYIKPMQENSKNKENNSETINILQLK